MLSGVSAVRGVLRRPTTRRIHRRAVPVRFYAEGFNFGKLVGDKAPKKDTGEEKKSIEDNYWNAASEDEKRRRDGVSSARVRRLAEDDLPAVKKAAKSKTETAAAAEAAAAAPTEAAPAAEEAAEAADPASGAAAAAGEAGRDEPPPPEKVAPEEMEFWNWVNQEKEEYEEENEHAMQPSFSVRAVQAAWLLHKQDRSTSGFKFRHRQPFGALGTFRF